MPMWEPWRGCIRYSEGCQFCYIHKGDAKRGQDTSQIVKTSKFDLPVQTIPKGLYKIKQNQMVYLCFSSDFLIEQADPWRQECWDMIHQRQDLHFLFLTKRITRFMDCIPPNWGQGYENVTVGCTIENQHRAEERLSVFSSLPIKHKNIICQPLIEKVTISAYLPGVELVVVGGESDTNARPLDYNWVLSIRQQCIQQGVSFQFRQCGTHFIKDGQSYTLPVNQLASQARKANIDC